MSKRKRTGLSLNDKCEILSAIAANTGKVELCKKFDCGMSTIYKILKDKDKIEEEFQRRDGGSKSAKKTFSDGLDAALYKWFALQRSESTPVSGPILQSKASELAIKLNVLPSTGTISTSWIQRFRKRHGIVLKKISGEAATVDVSIVANWVTNVWPIAKEGYNDDDIFNCDETGLMYKMLPENTLAFKGEKCSGGKKSKDRITVLLCANATGTEKLKPVVIGKSKNPRCFKGIHMQNLPVTYKANTKAWMTTELFTEFLQNWNKSLKRTKRNILLLLDNCTAHPNSIKNLSNIKLVFLPPNTTSKIQPLDAGIIKNMKHYYRTQVLMKHIHAIDTKGQFSVDIKDACFFVSSAWGKVSPLTIKNCYRHIGLTSTGTQDDEVVLEEGVRDEASEIFEALSNRSDLIPAGVQYDDYLSIDEEVLTSEISTDDELIAEITGNLVQDEDEEDADIELEIEKHVNSEDVLKYVNLIRDYVLKKVTNHEVSGKVCDCLTLLQMELISVGSIRKTQTTLTDYYPKIE